MTPWPDGKRPAGYSCNPLQGIELLHGVTIDRHTACPGCGQVQLRRHGMHVAGCHSADGTQLAYRPDQYGPAIAGWVRRLQAQPPLPVLDGVPA